MSVVRGRHETAFRNLSCDIDRLRRGARDARWPLWAEHEIRTAIVLSQFCRMTTEIPGRCGVGEPLWVEHWCRGSGGMPSRGTWAAASHSMPGEPSCPERKSVQIRFRARSGCWCGRLPRFYECCGCVEIFNRVPAGVHKFSTIGFSSECRGRGRNCWKCLKEK